MSIAKIIPFVRKSPAGGSPAVEISGEPGPEVDGSPLAPSFLAGASLVHDCRTGEPAHYIRPRGGAGVYRKPFGLGIWVYHPDGGSMPTACVTVPETRQALDAFLRSRLSHPSNITKGTS